jgi:hypothetical protein
LFFLGRAPTRILAPATHSWCLGAQQHGGVRPLSSSFPRASSPHPSTRAAATSSLSRSRGRRNAASSPSALRPRLSRARGGRRNAASSPSAPPSVVAPLPSTPLPVKEPPPSSPAKEPPPSSPVWSHHRCRRPSSASSAIRIYNITTLAASSAPRIHHRPPPSWICEFSPFLISYSCLGFLVSMLINLYHDYITGSLISC